jgi:hypothetical protein
VRRSIAPLPPGRPGQLGVCTWKSLLVSTNFSSLPSTSMSWLGMVLGVRLSPRTRTLIPSSAGVSWQSGQAYSPSASRLVQAWPSPEQAMIVVAVISAPLIYRTHFRIRLYKKPTPPGYG